jgi:membrane protease YdiL (CAAX protease family)
MNALPSRQLPWWQKLVFLFVQLIGFVLLGLLIGLLLELAGDQLLPSHWLEGELPALIWGWSVALCSALTAAYILVYAQSKEGWAALGFTTTKFSIGLQTGLLVGGGIILLCFLILYLGDWVNITQVTFVPGAFAGWCLFFMIQPLAEEVIMRSFLQNQVHRYFGAWPGLIVSALVFGLLHVGNNAFSWIAGLEIVLGGLLMGQLYLFTQNIWAPFAMHAIWNFLQSTVLGFAVSGMDTYRVLHLEIAGPEWLTGGDFGIEGSLLSVLFIFAAILYFWPSANNEAPWSKLEAERLFFLPEKPIHESDSV